MTLRLTPAAHAALDRRCDDLGVDRTSFFEAWGRLYARAYESRAPFPDHPLIDSVVEEARVIAKERRRRDRASFSADSDDEQTG